LVALFAAVGIAACYAGDPFAHSNPYDQAFPVAITVSGPDSLFSYMEQGTYSVQISPVFPDTAVIHWGVSDTAAFYPISSPTYEAWLLTPLWPATTTVTVQAGIAAFDTTGPALATTITAWRHVGYKTVVVTQRVVKIQLRCPNTHACDTLAVGDTTSAWADGFDALGHGILALTFPTTNPTTGPPVATFAVRDPTIASISAVGTRAAAVTARGSGTTWIVATRDVLLDSLQVVVR
jgi:hypothetical protein